MRLRWLLALALGAVVFSGGSLVAAGAIFAAALAACYLVSLQLHPRWPCKGCGGTGRHHGRLFFRANRSCIDCAGQGHNRRRGVQALYGRPGRLVWAERGLKQARKRPGAPRG